MSNAQHKEGQGHTKEFTIIVNGREHKVAQQILSFADVVKVAFPNPPTGENIVFTVTYRNADSEKREGTLIEGGTVNIKNGTIFNVTATDKS